MIEMLTHIKRIIVNIRSVKGVRSLEDMEWSTMVDFSIFRKGV